MMKEIYLTLQYDYLLHKTPRRTNECWLGNTSSHNSIYICGHKFLLRLENTSFAVWRLIDGHHSLAEIAEELESKYNVESRDILLEDLIACVLRLEKLGLVAWRSRPLFEDVSLDD